MPKAACTCFGFFYRSKKMAYLLLDNGTTHLFDESELVHRGGATFLHCRFHTDKDPSLSVDIDKGCYHCFGCKKSGKVVGEHEYDRGTPVWKKPEPLKYGRWVHEDTNTNTSDDWFDETNDLEEHQNEPVSTKKEVDWKNPIREHIYYDENNRPIHKKTIFPNKSRDGKTAIQYRYEKNVWETGLKDSDGKSVEQQLYNLNKIKISQGICFVEGEKDVDNLTKYEIPATTLGSSNAKLLPHHYKYLKDKKIVIIPDNDAAGYRFTRYLSEELYLNVSKDVSIAFLPVDRNNDGRDISDWIEENNPKREDIAMMLCSNVKRFVDCKSDLGICDGGDDKSDLTFLEELRPYEKFPTSEMPKVLSDIIREGAKSLYAPEDYFGVASLPIVGSLLSGKYVLNIGNDEWFAWTSFACALVGESGDNKSHPIKLIIKDLDKLDMQAHDEYRSKLAEYEKYLHSKTKNNGPPLEKEAENVDKPVEKIYVYNDFTIEALKSDIENNPQGTLIHCDELSGLFGGMNQYKGGNGNDLQNLMDMVDGNKKRVGRAAKEKKAMIKKPRLSLLGTIQPKIVKEAFSEYMKNSGFAFRFLFTAPNPVPFMIGKAIPYKYKNAYTELIHKCDQAILEISDGEAKPIEVRFTSDAKELFCDFINNYSNRIVKDHHTHEGVVKPMISKMRTYTPRFCLFIQLIRHLSENAELTVDIQSVKIGIRLTKYFMYHTYKMLNTTGYLEKDVYLNKLISYSSKRNQTTFTIRELVQNKIFGRNFKTQDVENILEEMQTAGRGILDTKNRKKSFTLQSEC